MAKFFVDGREKSRILKGEAPRIGALQLNQKL